MSVGRNIQTPDHSNIQLHTSELSLIWAQWRNGWFLKSGLIKDRGKTKKKGLHSNSKNQLKCPIGLHKYNNKRG